MEIYPVYTQLNQLCNPEETFYKLLTGYSPAFLFLSNSDKIDSRYTIIGRNPYITINKESDFTRLQIANEFFDINSSKIEFKKMFDDILSILKFNDEKHLDNEIPFYCGFACQKFCHASICFIPTEVIVFDRIKNNITVIVNTYHKECFEPEILFRANVKIARIIEDLKKQCVTENQNTFNSNEKVDIKPCEKNTFLVKKQFSFETLYKKITHYFKESHISVFFNGNTKIISVCYESNFKTEISQDNYNIFNFIKNTENFSGYFTLNNRSDFSIPVFSIIKNKNEIKIHFNENYNKDDLYIRNFFNIINE
ncbi:MAG: hypothetical protein WC002_07955 [Candidatus Muiribacteriota bacterium]